MLKFITSENCAAKQQELGNLDSLINNIDLKNYQSDKWSFEKEIYSLGFSRVAGVDEAGRGALAGPVVSAAVILPRCPHLFLGINDSKKISPKARNKLYDIIYDLSVAVGIGIVDSFEIDRINILNASLNSMLIAVQNLVSQPDCLLIDGNLKLSTNVPQLSIVKGDSLSVSIGAASIVAKVTRDRLMFQTSTIFPEFGFSNHKGYPTKAHKASIKRSGYCYMHRKTFKGVKEFFSRSKF